ncbi:MAG: pseudouridine synthase [Candidatus Pacebacteria bacterium]|nr:pseudouridine synthase [Candidatus Paceibacterota bacterium]
MEKIPLTKAIANSGFCSRRKAEELIRLKKVLVNNEPAQLGDRVNSSDSIKIKNKEVFFKKNQDLYIILNKPRGYVCTNRKFKNEKSIFDLIAEKQKLIIIGRLDKESEGLTLLSSDGDLTYKLSHPKFEHEKKYLVKTDNHQISFKTIEKSFLQGINIQEKTLAKAKIIKEKGKFNYEIILTQGLNRQIRKMFLNFNIQVINIKRVAIASLDLGNLPLGKYRYLDKNEVNELKKS